MIARLVGRLRALRQGLRGDPRLQAEMDEEFRLHQELRAADLERAGLAPAEARRRARLEFGSVERYKHEGRGSRGLRRADALHVSWLDVRLGFRMLARYPGITLVGGLAMAFAIWVGAGGFELVSQIVSPRLPLPGGDRIVGLQLWDAAAARPQRRLLHDLVAWRAELTTVREVGAFRTLERNLITDAGDAAPVEVAEINASAFRLTRVPPLLGRTLLESDERADAPPVAVIGHDLWQARFAGDSGVVGRTVRLGTLAATVVGVMPEGYAFPIAQRLWMPLRVSPLEHARGDGPALRAFGRLAPGASLAEAQAELTALGQRAAADHPATHEHLRPQVLPYANSILNLSGVETLLLRSTNLFLAMLLVLVCGNVALLLFARAATRESEIVVRTALGASRGRIVTQLFAEALVLGAVAAAVGLAAANTGLRWGLQVAEGELLNGSRLPFWFDASLSPATVLYAVGLTLLGAVIAGVVPALKVTNGLQARLREAGAGGGVRFGGVWTAVIVAQVAVTVAFPMTALLSYRDGQQLRDIVADFPAEEFLSLRLQLETEAGVAAPAGDAAATVAALEQRLVREPGVLGVTYADRLPRMYHPHRLVELDAGGAAPIDPRWPRGYRVSAATVAPDFFEVLQVPIRAGRGLHSADAASSAGAVVVNQSFATRVLGGRNPIGRRLRYVSYEDREPGEDGADEPSAWYEIVGVVPDLGMATSEDPKVAGIYHAMGDSAQLPLHVAVHVRGEPAALAPRVRALAVAVDPALRVDGLLPMDELSQAALEFSAFWFRLSALVSGMAVVLSLAGIYAVMSFTVARRTREIGVRVALGASARRVVAAVFVRPLAQVCGGVLAGSVLVALLGLAWSGGAVSATGVALLVGYAALMLAVCLLACIVPTRRALRVQPTEALRTDG